MNFDHTLKAYFQYSGSGGGGGCPILYIYNGKEYVEERVLQIHSPEGIDIVYSVTLTEEPYAISGEYYLLRLVEPDLPDSHSYIDQVRLLIVDEFGNTVESTLISAFHSTDGNVKPALRYSDDIRTDTLPYEHLDLKFEAPSLQGNIQHFTFEIEGYNPKWLLI